MPVMNLNAALTFADVLASEDDDALSLMHIDKSFPIMYDDSGNRVLRRLSLALFLNATESKNKDLVKKANPRSVFLFDNEYQFRVRLAEVNSGRTWNLKTFSLIPSKSNIRETPQFDIFTYTAVSTFSDIKLKEKKDAESFVIKVLVRPKNDESSMWVVQAVYPINVVEWEKPDKIDVDNHRLKEPSELDTSELCIDLIGDYIEKVEGKSANEAERL